MSKPCESLKDIINKLENGADADYIIPYDLSGFSEDCRKEIMALYIKYGSNDIRKDICRKGLGIC